ncbi:LysR family transcriptional regulator [Rhizobium calliandrae]|uniref:LysR family transcriptional regulator n=1 Tax=Rhizobium calliandrae TaxID=1312182 RepID=A0ABT7K8P5_9HYPH|nr:LysR family transcriptional regulator [Rhizobium calliandrae]MDL2404343.1 LysR family transcriptional regulator [Rhizobium calliandrae]
MDRLAAMETFVRVVETGSFSEAARHMRVGQPAVSKTVAQLEERLGVKLLLRSTRGLTPTESGQSFYERAKRAIDEADEADLAARGAGASLSGRLRVSAATTFASLHVVPHLPKFLAAHPDLQIEVILDDEKIDLIEEGIDVSLRMGDLADSSLMARRISRARRLVVGAPVYFKHAGVPASPDALAAHETVVYARGAGRDVWTFRKGDAETTVTLNGRVRVSAGEGVRAAVLAGMGVTVASEWMFARELVNGDIRAVLTDWTIAPIDLWAVFPTGRVATAKARAFVAFVEEQLALAPKPAV